MTSLAVKFVASSNRHRCDFIFKSVTTRLVAEPHTCLGCSIQPGMDKVAEGLERGLRMERVAPMDLEIVLEKLLSDLKPHQGAKKCRPYELFLFAAQNRLSWGGGVNVG